MPQDEGTDNLDGAGAKPLPADIREHLGRRLRASLTVEADKPAYLGDPAVPPQFERFVRQLESGERSHREGVRAVSRALGVDESEVDGVPARPPADGQGPDQR
jgi:hypothetical protein